MSASISQNMERDILLFEDVVSGMPYKEAKVKYHITTARISHIVYVFYKWVRVRYLGKNERNGKLPYDYNLENARAEKDELLPAIQRVKQQYHLA